LTFLSTRKLPSADTLCGRPLILNRLSWKLAHRLLLPRVRVTPILAFPRLLVSS